MHEGRNRRNDPDDRGSVFDDAAEGSRSQSGGRGAGSGRAYPHDQGQGRYPAYGGDRSRDARRLSERETYEGGFGESNFGDYDGGIDRTRYADRTRHGAGRDQQRGAYSGDNDQVCRVSGRRAGAGNPVEQAWGGTNLDDLDDEWGPSSWNPPQRARSDWRDEEFLTGQPGSGNRWPGTPAGNWRNDHAPGYGGNAGHHVSGGMRGDATSYHTRQHGGADPWHGGDRAYDQFTGVNARSSQRDPSRQRVGPKGYQRSDERIHEEVCERFTHSDYHVADVEVAVAAGSVTLSGTVRSRAEKYRLEDIAVSTFGVKDVENRLRTGAGEQRQAERSGASAGSTGGSGVSGVGTASTATEGGIGNRAGLQPRTPETPSPGDNLH